MKVMGPMDKVCGVHSQTAGMIRKTPNSSRSPKEGFTDTDPQITFFRPP